jgi:hypothetical protein
MTENRRIARRTAKLLSRNRRKTPDNSFLDEAAILADNLIIRLGEIS